MSRTIAFQGRHGAYSESAAYHLFGNDTVVKPLDTFNEIYELVHSGAVDGGVIPIENSTAGSIHDNYDLLLQWRLPIVGEVKIRIAHTLMALPGTKLEDLREVHSHPQALAQCSKFFAEYTAIAKVASFDTAGSAEEIARLGKQGVGAIASAQAARRYGLQILIDELENNKGCNYTRFFAIVREAPAIDLDRDTKTSIAFAPRKDQAGSLYEALGCFAKRGINLSRIESRPLPGTPWEYIFYLDFQGNPLQKHVAEAMQQLTDTCAMVTHLGSYPDGEHRHLQYTEQL